MRERTWEILGYALRDYIKTGESITSDRLYRLYDFGIKPAMIRWELNDLSDAGYLMQTHHSGGRSPTDKGYKYLAESLINNLDCDVSRLLRERASELINFLNYNREKRFIEEFSRYLNAFGVSYEPEASEIYESGLSNLFDGLENISRQELIQIARDLDKLPDRLQAVSEEWFLDDVWPKVFIGENPIIRSNHLSILAQRICHSGGDFIVLAIGPKRMDYQKSLRLFNQLGRDGDLQKFRRSQKNKNTNGGRKRQK